MLDYLLCIDILQRVFGNGDRLHSVEKGLPFSWLNVGIQPARQVICAGTDLKLSHFGRGQIVFDGPTRKEGSELLLSDFTNASFFHGPYRNKSKSQPENDR